MEHIESQTIALVRDFSKMKDKTKSNPLTNEKDKKSLGVPFKGQTSYEMSEKIDDAHLSEVLPEKDEEYDIVVDVSDEENSFERLLQWTPKEKASPPTPKSDDSPPKLKKSFGKEEYDMYYSLKGEISLSVLASNFRRGVKTEESNSSTANLPVRKISFTPTANKMKLKTPKLEPEETGIPRKRISVQNPNCNEASKKTRKKFVKTKFRPLKEMHLTSKQERIALYVFQSHGDASEVLYKVEDACFTREDLQCFCYPNGIRSEIIRALALQFTLDQRGTKCQNFWMLPPSFAVDALCDKPVEHMLETYASVWMPPYAGLKYIYVPMQEVTSQWFLVVISINDSMIYHLDSFLDERTVIARSLRIKRMTKVLGKCLDSNYYPSKYFKHLSPLGDWEIKVPEPMLDEPYGENSAVWVIEWMHMRDAFNTNIVTKMNEKVVRMRICLYLLCGYHNDVWDELQHNSDQFWRKITGCV
ncbi:Ulp1 protease family, C-terminal catalytic domain [Sesbania bispinosa]|nr:Ulp1 protease family, C-terminal catalytic domain [Sesbania bispinosa]